MSDWQVGDLAVCVDDCPCPVTKRPVRGIHAGKSYTVAGFIQFKEKTFLRLAGVEAVSQSGGFFPHRFRKIRPDEHEACEEEFRILLKLSKQRVSA
jgi:hypothetical protein